MKKAIIVLMAASLVILALVPVVFAAELKVLRGQYLYGIPGIGKSIDLLAQLKAKKDKTPADETNLRVLEYLETEMNKIGYTIVNEDWGWAEALEQKQLAAILIGEGPDIFVGEVHMPSLAKQGAFVDLSGEPWLKDCISAAYAGMTFDGKVYGVAGTAAPNTFEWYKELFALAGLDPKKAPTHWDEWVSMADKITTVGKGKFFGGGVYAGDSLGGPLRTTIFLRQMAGADYADSQGNPTLNTPQFEQVLTFIRALNKNVPGGAAALPNEDAFGRLVSNKEIATWATGFRNWNPENPVFGLSGELPLPWGGSQTNALIAMGIYSVTKFSKNQEAAKKFLGLMMSPFVQINVGIASGWEKSRTFSKTAWKQLEATATAFDKQVNKLLDLPNVKGLITFPKENAKMYRLIQEAYVRAQVTDEPIAQILKDVQAKAESILK